MDRNKQRGFSDGKKTGQRNRPYGAEDQRMDDIIIEIVNILLTDGFIKSIIIIFHNGRRSAFLYEYEYVDC